MTTSSSDDDLTRLVEQTTNPLHHIPQLLLGIGILSLVFGMLAVREVTTPSPSLPPFHTPGFLSDTERSASRSSMISINDATVDELDQLPGIGAVRAQKIYDAKPYANLQELQQKTSLSASVVQQLAPYVSF